MSQPFNYLNIQKWGLGLSIICISMILWVTFVRSCKLYFSDLMLCISVREVLGLAPIGTRGQGLVKLRWVNQSPDNEWSSPKTLTKQSENSKKKADHLHKLVKNTTIPFFISSKASVEPTLVTDQHALRGSGFSISCRVENSKSELSSNSE